MSISDSQLTQVLNALQDDKYCIVDNLLPKEIYEQLCTEATNQLYHDAKITDGLKQNIRSDGIAWIEKGNTGQVHAEQFITILKELAEQLNRHFFVGIRRTEAHFACYSAGKFYSKHVDNPKGSDNRVFSCVFYMNDNWQVDDGGELIIYTDTQEKKVLAQGNRLVIFDSNLAHEVKPANRTRYSIACWLRKDDVIS